MTTKLMKCTCNHAFQDEMYGYRNRMANEMRSGQYRCTSCSTVLGSSQSIAQQVKKEPAKDVVKEAPKKEERKSGPSVSKKKEVKKDIKLKGSEKKNVKKSSMKGGKR